jgi:protein-disulfide isomerase
MKSQYILPITIVVAGLLIAGAVFFVGKSGTTPPVANNGQEQAIDFRPADATDHILGNPNATVKVIEYADLECPYCKVFNTTMHQVMDYYGQSGQVAWIFRPFPLGQIHSKAPEEAQAAECAADQGGSAAFFAYIDKVYAVTPSENNLDLTQLPVFAKDQNLNVDTFNTCLSSGKYAAKVQDSYNEAIKAGGQGTPYILITKTGSTDAIPLSGAQPYDSMRAAIDAVLGNAPAAASTTAPAATPAQ